MLKKSDWKTIRPQRFVKIKAPDGFTDFFLSYFLRKLDVFFIGDQAGNIFQQLIVFLLHCVLYWLLIKIAKVVIGFLFYLFIGVNLLTCA
jgi:hypothetical protein